MFDGRMYYEKENKAVQNDFLESVDTLTHLMQEKFPGLSSPYREFFERDGEFLMNLIDHENRLSFEYLFSQSLDDLRIQNHRLFDELDPVSYERSYANPAWCAAIFGREFGPLMSFFHVQNRQHIVHAHRHERFEMLETHRSFLEAYGHLKGARPDPDALGEILTVRFRKDKTYKFLRDLKERFSPDYNLAGLWCEGKVDDPRLLFLHGRRVSDAAIRTAGYINSLPQKEIDAIARSVASAYARGFIAENKDRSGRTLCGIWGCLGHERIYWSLITCLKDEGFDGYLKSLHTPPINRQYDFDHRFDIGLYLTDQSAARSEIEYKAALDACAALCRRYAGAIYFETFNPGPFTPSLKTENVKLTPDQRHVLAEHNRTISELYFRSFPREQISNTMVSLPSAEIGERFEDIFREMISINTLDPEKYSIIQKNIIDILDTSTCVRVIGKDGNRTDVTVQLHRLEHPDRESNFVNCGADVNIPLGEVYTTPRLEGTNGILHFREAHLCNHCYRDLRLEFINGMVTRYSCGNYPTEDEKKRYIVETLLFPYQTLPMGEFAIGTNTRAFAMSRRYGITEFLPELIVEKMGPHFALGDTCFSHKEDHPTFNMVDGKRIAAKDNEKSILRKTDPLKAYTDTHIDITLPFDEIGLLISVSADGIETDIIRDGRFVLPGTEELNKPLAELD